MSSIPTLSGAPAPARAQPAGWLVPISPLEPCGPSLEYDHEYAVLAGRMTPRTDAQYGDFVGAAESPNWAEIERDCNRLLLRTRDIYLLVWLCRARTRLGQAAGLVHVLTMLAELLHAWPDAVHPQRTLDGEYEPALCANALAALADPEGLVADVCEIALASNTALRLTVRDVERAFAVPRHPAAPSPEAVRQQLLDLRTASQRDEQSPVRLLARAATQLRAIDAWSKEQLGDDAPSLRGLSRILGLFADPAPQAGAQARAAAAHATEPLRDQPASALPAAAGAAIPRTRADVLRTLHGAREWLETHEPSSPVAVLLKQAERMIGKRFSQVADCIPLDLLHKWDAEDGQDATAPSGGAA